MQDPKEREIYERERLRENEIARSNANANFSSGLLVGIAIVAILAIAGGTWFVIARDTTQSQESQPPDINVQPPDVNVDAPEPPQVEAPDVDIKLPDAQGSGQSDSSSGSQGSNQSDSSSGAASESSQQSQEQ